MNFQVTKYFHPNVDQNTMQKGDMHSYEHFSTINNSPNMERNQASKNRQVNEKAIVHLYSGIPQSYKKKEIMKYTDT